MRDLTLKSHTFISRKLAIDNFSNQLQRKDTFFLSILLRFTEVISVIPTFSNFTI